MARRSAYHPVGFHNSATGADLGFYAARSYSLMRPPRTDRRWIRSRKRSATGWAGRGRAELHLEQCGALPASGHSPPAAARSRPGGRRVDALIRCGSARAFRHLHGRRDGGRMASVRIIRSTSQCAVLSPAATQQAGHRRCDQAYRSGLVGQQGSRTVSAAVAGFRSHLKCCVVPGIYTFADDGYSLSPPWPRHPRPWWSRPVHTDVCSMFARMSRYGLTAGVIIRYDVSHVRGISSLVRA